MQKLYFWFIIVWVHYNNILLYSNITLHYNILQYSTLLYITLHYNNITCDAFNLALVIFPYTCAREQQTRYIVDVHLQKERKKFEKFLFHLHPRERLIL